MQPEIQDSMILEREWFTDKSTVGSLSFDGDHFCFTLEDSCRRKKKNGETAIPSGRYQVVLDWSGRFQKIMPHILNVPGFEGIRIHPGNRAEDSEGCIIPGLRKDKDVVYDSKKAFDLVLEEIDRRLKKGPLFLTIVGGISKDQFMA